VNPPNRLGELPADDVSLDLLPRPLGRRAGDALAAWSMLTPSKASAINSAAASA